MIGDKDLDQQTLGGCGGDPEWDNKDHYEIDLAVKVGGSCLTDKAGYERLREGGLERLAELAARIDAAPVEDNDGRRRRRRRWILVHGAGSFGHPQAKAARLTEGAPPPAGATDDSAAVAEELRRRRLGFCDTRRSVLALANSVTAGLVTAGVPAVALSPCGHYRSRADRLAAHWPAALARQTRALLSAGFAPQLHGDAVPEVDDEEEEEDGSGSWAVLSGDDLLAQLAGSFRVRRVVFVTEAGGVFSGDPATQADARLLPEVRLCGGGGVAGVGGAAPGVADVTGGMGGKLGAVARLLLASRRTEVRVCGWRDAAAACLTGGGGGTRVVMADD